LFNWLKRLKAGSRHVVDMKLTAQIKLLPSDEQALCLLRTLERANEACQYISDYAHESGEHSKYKLQEAVYHDVRERFDLAAQMTIRALGKVADAYKTNPDTGPPLVWWTFPHFRTNRDKTCQELVHRIRKNLEIESLSWLETGELLQS
jgi:predicted transposase